MNASGVTPLVFSQGFGQLFYLAGHERRNGHAYFRFGPHFEEEWDY